MKSKLPLAVMLSMATVLSACKNEEVHTVAYFAADKTARVEQLEKCELEHRADDDANCVNAREAARQVQRERESKAFEKMFGAPKQ